LQKNKGARVKAIAVSSFDEAEKFLSGAKEGDVI